MKLNEMICPNCSHKFYTDCSYGTCDACNTFFYASQMLPLNYNHATLFKINTIPIPTRFINDDSTAGRFWNR